GARDWAARAPRRAAELPELLAVQPALDALDVVAALAVDSAPLATLWPALRAFIADWLLLPGDGPRVTAALDAALTPALPLAGNALAVVAATLDRLRLPEGRFGEPAVTVGTIAGA